jgi:hypothetical protein
MIANASNNPKMLTVFIVFMISSSWPFDSRSEKRFQSEVWPVRNVSAMVKPFGGLFI